MKARDWALPVIIILALLAALGWYLYRSAESDEAAAISAPAPSAEPAPVAQPALPTASAEPQYPVPEASPEPADKPREKLPELSGSDAELRESLNTLLGPAPLSAYLVPTDLIRRFVVMIDNLGAPSLPMRSRSVRKIEGGFGVQAQPDGTLLIGPANAARYAGFVEALRALDAKAAAQLYLHYYPLFQSAYGELGRRGYFNDRLVAVIDLLLATPDVAGPVAVQRANALYAYVDPTLESLASGQKLLLRLGPDNAAIVKAKLRELRSEIVARRLDPRAR